jgi:hypothetical protein
VADKDQEPVVELTCSDINVTFEILNPYYGDVEEEVTLYDVFNEAVGK